MVSHSTTGSSNGCCGPYNLRENIHPLAIIIVASGFIINTIFGGLSYITGLYLNSFLKEYNAGKTVTAWVISLQGSIMYFSGIIAGPLIARYGTRLVAVAGALLSTGGFLLSAFSPNLEFLYLSFAIMSGTGFGLLLISNGVAVQQHTTKRRALAGGIAFIGSGLGTIIMPLISKWALVTYGWRGSLIFLSGMLLHTLPCGLLLRPPPQFLPSGHKKEPNIEGKTTIRFPDDGLTMSDSSSVRTLMLKNPLRQDAINCGSTISLPLVYASTLSINKLNHMPRLESSTKSEKIFNLRNCWNSFKAFFPASSDESEPLLTPVTILVIVSWFFLFAGTHVFYVFMAEKAVSMGYEISIRAKLMSITGIGEISGRIIGAILGTMHEDLPVIIKASMAMAAGVCTASIVLCTTYNHVMMACIGFGIGNGMATCMMTTAVRDLVGINRVPWAVGMASASGGIGNLVTILGLAYAWEQTGSFFIPYLIGGAMHIVCGVCLISAKFAKKLEDTKRQAMVIEAVVE